MANAEQQLISRIVHSGNLPAVLEWGITVDDFRTTEGKSLFNAILTYYSSPSSNMAVLGPNIYPGIFPQIPLVADNAMTTEALCHEVRKARVIAESKERYTEFLSEVETNPEVALNEMHARFTKLLSLGVRKNTDVTMSAALGRIMTRYQMLKQHGPGVFAKMLWPWDIMNEHTGGLQEDDYVVIYGRPKSMKTWVLSALVGSAFEQGKRALIYTKEMTQDNIFMRGSAVVGRIPYQEFRGGKLDADHEYILEQLREFSEQSAFDPICLDGRGAEGGDTVAWLQSKVEKYKPDVIFIDGMYLLKSMARKTAATWEHVTDISRSIRNMVLHTRIPAVCTMQANRSAAKHSAGNLDELAYADAIGQDVTIAMRSIAEKSSPTIALVMAGSREFKLHGFRINAVPAVDFSFKEVMTEKDIRKAEENDTGEEADDPANHAKARKPKPAVRSNVTNGESALEKAMQQQLNDLPNG